MQIRKQIWICAALLCTQTFASPPEGASQATPEPAPVPAPAPDTVASDNAAALEFARRNGYRLVTRNNETVFCRREDTTGSRVRAQERCFTQKQLVQMAESAQKLLMEQTGRMMQPREGG